MRGRSNICAGLCRKQNPTIASPIRLVRARGFSSMPLPHILSACMHVPKRHGTSYMDNQARIRPLGQLVRAPPLAHTHTRRAKPPEGVAFCCIIGKRRERARSQQPLPPPPTVGECATVRVECARECVAAIVLM